MKRSRTSTSANSLQKSLFLLAAGLSLGSAKAANWLPTAGGTYSYNDPANWNGGLIDGIFDSTLTGSQVVTFNADTTLSATGGNALNFSYTTANGITFQSDADGVVRVLTLGGNITAAAPAAARTITIGTTVDPLTLSLGGNTYTVTANGANTIALNALITGGGSLNQATGAGTVKYASDANSFSGSWQMGGGTVQFTSLTDAGNNSALGAGSQVIFANATSGAIFSYVGSTAATSNRSMSLTGSGVVTMQTTAGQGNLTLTGNITASNGGARTLALNPGTGGLLEIDGVLQNQTDANFFNVTKGGGGTAALLGANTYAGTTAVLSGTLKFNSIGNVGSGPSSLGAPTTAAKGTIAMGNSGNAGTLQYVGSANATTDRIIDLATNASDTLDSSGSGSITFTSDFTSSLAAAKTLILSGTNGGANRISGAIVDNSAVNKTSLTKSGIGTWAVSGNSSFSGKTTVQSGILEFTSVANVGGGNSSLGAPITIADGTIALGVTGTSATLRYTGGSSSTTDRVVNLAGTTGGATLESSGAGSVTFTSNLTATGAGSKTLTLSGSNTGANTFLGSIVDNSGVNKTSLVKDGTGRWVLSGANTYTGSTMVSAGSLIIDGSLAAGSTVTVSNGATLGGKGTVNGNAALASGATLSPGNGLGDAETLRTGALTLNGASIINFDLGTASDLVAVSGNLTLGGLLDINATTGFGAGTYTLFTYTGIASGSLTVGSGPSEWNYSFQDTGNSYQLIVAAVPEPSTMALGVLSSVALAAFAVRRRNQSV